MNFGETLYGMMYKLLSPFGMESSAADRDKWARFPFGDLSDAEQNHIQMAFEKKLQEIVAYLGENGLTIADLMENGEWKSGNEDFIGLLSQLAKSIGCTYDSTAGALMFSVNGSTTDGPFPFVAVKATAAATDKTYLVSGSTLSAIGDAIRAKEGTTEKYRPATMAQKITDDLVKPSGTLQIKSAQQVDVRSYQYAKVTDANLTAGNIKKDVTILGVTGTHEGGGGGAEPATLTLTSTDYTGDVYGTFMFVNSEGHAEQLNRSLSPFTFPVTIKTVIGGVVVFVPSGLPGIPSYTNLIGGEGMKYSTTFYILVNSPQASITIYNFD